MENLAIPFILGVVEGLTEFLPVSSTGHLIIAGHLLGFVGDKASSFEVAIQSGAILAVVVLYWRRFLGLLPIDQASNFVPASSMRGLRGVLRIVLATVPALAVGFLARRIIKEHLFTPGAVAIAFIAGALGILLAERWVGKRRTNPLDSITTSQALGVGLFQVLALWPGTSRAAATIIGGMLLGLDRKGAAEFSFLIAVPVLVAATGYEMLKLHGGFNTPEMTQFAIGFAVSFVVALGTVRSFVLYLQRWNFVPFAWYRIIVAPIFYLLTRRVGL